MWGRTRKRPEKEEVMDYEPVLPTVKVMTKEQIQKKIDKNRDLIERALHTDLEPCLMAKIVHQLKEKNDRLIEQLNS